MGNYFDYTTAQRAKRYIKIMHDLTGIDALLKTRRREVMICRAIIAARMLNDGSTTIATGNALGVSHSTVIYYREAVKDMIQIPQYYKGEYTLWQDFNKTVDAL